MLPGVDLWAQQVDSQNHGHCWALHAPAVKILCCISEPEINCNSWWAFIITFWMSMSGLSLTPSSQHDALHFCWACSEGLPEMCVALSWVELSFKREMGRCNPWEEAFSLLPCKGLGVLQRHFAGKWMNVFRAVPGIHFIVEESMF